VVAGVLAAALLGQPAMTGAGEQPPPPSGFFFDPEALDFDSVQIGAASTPRTLTLGNSSDGERITIKGIARTGAAAGDFAIVPGSDRCTGQILSFEDTCTLQLIFQPTVTGSRAASLRVDFTNCEFCGPAQISLRGTGLAPPPQPTPGQFSASPAVVSFGTAPLGVTTAAATVTVAPAPGSGDRGFRIDGVGLPTPPGQVPGDYRITADTCTGRRLVGTQSCTVSVVFTPGAPGDRPATLRFDDDAPGAPHLVGLRGTGGQPTIALNPAVIRTGGVVMMTGAGWPPNANVSLAVEHLPAPIAVQATAGGTFAMPVVIFQNGMWGPRTVTAAMPTNAAVNSGAPTPLLVQVTSASPADFVSRH
jgi:hypothetical protein